jgi:hypothetical protein
VGAPAPPAPVVAPAAPEAVAEPPAPVAAAPESTAAASSAEAMAPAAAAPSEGAAASSSSTPAFVPAQPLPEYDAAFTSAAVRAAPAGRRVRVDGPGADVWRQRVHARQGGPRVPGRAGRLHPAVLGAHAAECAGGGRERARGA